MPRPELSRALADADAALFGARAHVAFSELAGANFLSLDPATLKGANVLIRTADQLHAALALVALDGIAARMVIAPPDLSNEHIPGVIARAGLDTQVSDGAPWPGLRSVSVSHVAASQGATRAPADLDTEWVLFTSGTTGAPKMVAHTLSALAGAIPPPRGGAAGGGGARSSACDAKGGGGDITWGTFYDVRRYGGLQILLRALLGRASLILSDADEPVGDFLARLEGMASRISRARLRIGGAH